MVYALAVPLVDDVVAVQLKAALAMPALRVTPTAAPSAAMAFLLRMKRFISWISCPLWSPDWGVGFATRSTQPRRPIEACASTLHPTNGKPPGLPTDHTLDGPPQ